MNTLATPDLSESALPPVIGVVASQLHNPQQQKMLESVVRQLNARGVVTLFLNAETDAELAALIHQAMPLAPRGLLLMPGQKITDACNLPVLQIDAEPEFLADAQRAGEASAALLLAQGHKRFGFLQSQPGAPVQKQSFTTRLLAEGLKLDTELLAEGGDRDSAYQAMTGYLKRTRAAERIQALCCESDLLALGAMQAIRDFGQGAHLAVVGFGDSDEAHSSTWHLTSWLSHTGQMVGSVLDRWLGQNTGNSPVAGQGEMQRRHSHFGKERPGEMSACGCTFRH